MNHVVPTDEQRTVIESPDTHLVVAAAAGSGKTRVLVERFLRLVDEGRSPDQILTITYTRKAAAVMKERIVSGLKARKMLDEAQIAETGPIQTIHGFCERTLRENAIAAGLDPDFEIIEQSDQRTLVARSITESLAQPFSQDDEDPYAMELVEVLAGRRGGSRPSGEQESPHELLINAVMRVIDKFRGTSISVDDLEAIAASPEALLKQWEEKVIESQPHAVRMALGDDGPLSQRLERAYKEAKAARPKWVKRQDDDEICAARHSVALIKLACSAWRKIEQDMKRRAKLDFTLLERLAVDLVAGNRAVQERLASQYPVVFIDEAQDLNPMQYRLIRALDSGDRMLVGDAQQSIYGFRLADVNLFRDHQTKEDVVPLPLSRNFRSAPGILAFVDAVFGKVWPEAYRPMSQQDNLIYLEGAPGPEFGGVEVWPQEQRDSAAIARLTQCVVDERIANGGQAKDVCILVRRTMFGVELLRRLERLGVKARLAGGTERYFTRMEVRDVANALRALVNPHDDFSLLATLRSPFAGVSLDGIVRLSKREEGDRRTLFTRVEEGAIELSDADGAVVSQFRAWFDPLRAYADRLAAWEAIGELYAVSPFLENLGKRDNYPQLLANARKLLALASARPEMSPTEYAERVRETQRLRHPEGEAPIDDDHVDAVTIMTIHKAKGLEFPVVIVPETHDMVSKSPWGWTMADARLPMLATQFPGGKNLFYDFLVDRETHREADENWRVMYVALTRAQQRLCVVIDPRKRGDTFGGSIAKHIGYRQEEPPRGLVVRQV